MKTLLKICIAGLLALTLTSCEELRYEVPAGYNCALLSKSVFCVHSKTFDEFEMPISEAVGYVCRDRGYDERLEQFGNMIMMENLRFSKCRDKQCIRDIVREHNRNNEDE